MKPPIILWKLADSVFKILTTRSAYKLRRRLLALFQIEFGPFNDQEHRQKIFLEIVKRCRPKACVETGTHYGETTRYIAQHSAGPVHSVEFAESSHRIASERLEDLANVRLYNEDSLGFLKRFLSGWELKDESIFFYLDAHWYDDIPLLDEMATILESCRDPIIMIDDFQVPGEDGYHYDDYGNGNKFSLAYLDRLESNRDFSVFFPSAASESETGLRRGCVVVTATDEARDALAQASSLRMHSPAS